MGLTSALENLRMKTTKSFSRVPRQRFFTCMALQAGIRSPCSRLGMTSRAKPDGSRETCLRLHQTKRLFLLIRRFGNAWASMR
jgi:hypothetical protein